MILKPATFMALNLTYTYKCMEALDEVDAAIMDW